jgi:hypothetical protein
VIHNLVPVLKNQKQEDQEFQANKRNANKSTLRFHLTPVRMAIIKNTNNKCCQGCGGKGPHTLLGRMKMSTTPMESSMEGPQNSKN